MKFEIKDFKKGGYMLFEKSNNYDWLIWLGDIDLPKENYKKISNCDQNEYKFDYHGIENAICGKERFINKRILVIQMK